MRVELPNELFVFVDRTAFATRNNYNRGGFTSRCATLFCTAEGARQYDQGEIDLLPFRQNPDQYPDLSPFVLNLITEQWVEWEAERLRKAICPSAPSRLSAIYAFGDQESCRAAAQHHGWNLQTVRRFVPAPGVPWRAIRVNMEVVSLMRTVYRLASWSTENADFIWSHYWRGEGNLQLETMDVEGSGRRTWDSGVIWEWLFEGRLVSTDTSPVFGDAPRR